MRAGTSGSDRRSNGRYGSWVQQRRAALGYGARELARLAKVAYSTIKDIEAGRASPRLTTRAVLDRILGERAPVNSQAIAGVFWWAAPHYAPMADLQTLRSLVSGPGGEIEPRMLYVDQAGSAAWLRLCKQEPYSTFYRETLPVREAARVITDCIGAQPVTVVGLGSGDGASETRLVQALIDRRGDEGLTMQLLDFAPFLLNGAVQEVREKLPAIELYGILADFWRLQDVAPILLKPGVARVYSMFGGTFANANDERRLLETIATCSTVGDYLLFDFALCYAPSDDADAVRRSDPALQRPLTGTMAEWMALPIRQFVPREAEITVIPELATPAVIPGSYEIRCVAIVKQPGGDRRFLVTRSKRYEPEQLQAALPALGWEPVACLPFLTSERTDALMIARRRG